MYSSPVIPKTKKGFEAKECVGFYRGMILDAVEMVLDGDPAWKQTRSMLLKLLGDQGLEKKMVDIIEKE